MNAKLSLHITRSSKRWHVETIVDWNTGGGNNHSHSGYRTLALALWSCLYLGDHDITLDKLTLKGHPLARSKAYSIIRKDLLGTPLEYRLPAYKKVLGQ